MQFEMWVMPTCAFLRESELRPHEVLRDEGLIVRVDDSMRNIFYISHEWTARDVPDHSMCRLHTFQALLLRMLRGDLPETAPTFADAIRLPSTVNIAASRWQALVRDSYVWLDFMSVSKKEVIVRPQRTPLTRIRCHGADTARGRGRQREGNTIDGRLY